MEWTCKAAQGQSNERKDTRGKGSEERNNGCKVTEMHRGETKSKDLQWKGLELTAMERRRKRGQGGAWHGDTMQRNRLEPIRDAEEMKRGELQ